MMDEDRRKAKEAVKDMPFGAKVKYFFGYYKIHVLVITAIVIAVLLFIKTQIDRKDAVLYFGIMNSGSINEEYLEEEMKTVLDLGKKETVTVHKEMTSAATMNGQDMTSVYLAVDQLNIIFTDEEGLKFLVDSEAVISLEQWCDLNEYPEWQKLVYKYSGYDVGIDISGLSVFEKLGLGADTKYMLVAAKPGREENVAKFIDWIYNAK